MPWKEMSPVTERMRFILDVQKDLFSIAELADRYEISRKTAYKWIERYDADGPGGLEDRSSAADRVANRTPAEIEDLVIAFRIKHPTWGPKKTLKRLTDDHPELALPARSTVAAILKRSGLVEPRPRRRKEGHPGRPQCLATAANDIWGADFKGHFKTRDGLYCYPFTVSDLFSRFIISCDGQLSTDTGPVQAAFERAFREYGMPLAIRTDNGSPFGSTGIARLTRLSVWFLKLGIRRDLIQPGRPDQNGCHERMHRTLKREATKPPEANLRKQRKRFDAFRSEFNYERPHEAIAMRRPAEVFTPSPRPFPDRLESPHYPAHFEVRRVSRNGGIRWKGEWLNVGHSLIEQDLGFVEVQDGIWDAYFASLLIGRFDERDRRLVGTLATPRRYEKRGNRLGGHANRPASPGDSLSFHSAATTRKC